MSERIYLSAPDVTELEEQALIRAFRTGWIAPLGPEVDAFEQELCDFTGRSHCVALSSGTAALHLGLLTLGVGPGDVVVTSTMTFAATANAIVYTGAEPYFVDSDASGNMNPDLLVEALDELAAQGITPAAIVPVDLLGKVADHDRIDAIAAARGIPVLSDAAESLGAKRGGRPSASFGWAAAVSFNGNKIMTTSGGGALLTDDAEVAHRVRYLATQARQPVVHYEHTEVGYNYRLSNLLAALGRAQLGRLDSMIERRRQLRLHYRELFAGVPGVTIFGEPSGAVGPPGESSGAGGPSGAGSFAVSGPFPGRSPLPEGGLFPEPVEGTRDNFWLTSILVDAEAAGFTAEDLRLALAEANIEARPLWKPMHLQPVFAGARAYVDGASERLFRTGLSLPSGSVLGPLEVARVDTAVERFLEAIRVPA